MKTIKHPIKKLALLLVLAMGVACSSDSDGDDNGGIQNPSAVTIVDVAGNESNLTSFLAALDAASGNLDNTLNGNGPFTVFAPTDAAFEAFLDGRALADIPAGDLQQLLLNHVISGDIASSGLSSGYRSSLSTAGAGGNNLSLLIINNNGITINDDAMVTTPDLVADNGRIHVVNAVIDLPTIQDVVAKDPNLVEFANSLEAFPPANGTFVDILDGPGSLTLFAPSNQASNNFDNPNGNDIPNVILNHIMEGALALDDFTTTYELTSMATNADGDNLSYFVDTDSGPDVVINGTVMGNADNKNIITTNGIVHIVESIIDLPTILTLAEADPNLEEIIGLLDGVTIPNADPSEDTFRELLETGGPFTIFAPQDTEVTALIEAQSNGTELVDILFHHVLDGNIRSEDLSNGLSAITREGSNITFQLPGSGDAIANIIDGAGNSDIGVIIVDIQAIDGVIHVTDSVLLP